MDSLGVGLGHFERDFMFDFDLQGQQLFIKQSFIGYSVMSCARSSAFGSIYSIIIIE